MRYIKLLFNVLILGLVFIFFAENYEVLQYKVQLQFSLFFSQPYLFPSINLYMLLLLVFFIAVVIVLLIVGKEAFSLRLAKRRLERIIKEQETELVQLRTLPLKEHTLPKTSTENVEDTTSPQ